MKILVESNELILNCIEKFFQENQNVLVVPDNINLKNNLIEIQYKDCLFIVNIKDYVELFNNINDDDRKEWIKNHLMVYICKSIYDELAKKITA